MSKFEYLTVAEVAARIRRGPEFVYRRIGPKARTKLGPARMIPAQKCGRNWLIPVDGLAAFLRQENRGLPLEVGESRIPADTANDAIPGAFGGVMGKKRESSQEGSIEQLGRNKFKVRWWQRGVRKDGTFGWLHPSKTLKDVTKAAAKNFLAEKINELRQDPTNGKGTMTLERYVEQHYKPLMFGDENHPGLLRPSWQESVRATLKLYILPRFGSTPLCDITPVQIQEMLNYLAGHLSRQSLIHIRNCLNGIFRQPFREEWIKKNSAALVVIPRSKVQGRGSGIALTVEQVCQLQAVANGQDYLLLFFVLMTGLRRGEICGSRVEDLDLEKGLLRVEETIVRGRKGTTKTKAGKRVLPLPTPLVAVLRRYLRDEWIPNPDNLLFTTTVGTPLSGNNYVKRNLKQLARRASIPQFNLKDLRRTHGTHASRLLPDFLLKKQLGHAPQGVTYQHYVEHHDPELRRSGIEQLCRLLYPHCTSERENGGNQQEQLVRQLQAESLEAPTCKTVREDETVH